MDDTYFLLSKYGYYIFKIHPARECFLTKFSEGGFVKTSPNPQAGGPPLVGCPRLLIQFIRSYFSPNIVRVIKSRRMRWAGHVARMVEGRGCIGSWWGNRREGDHWEDLGVDGWMILGWISGRWDVGIWTGLGWFRIETVDGRL